MAQTLFEYVGGKEFFVQLVDYFYDEVAEDAFLRPMYPEENLDGAKQRLALFLIQYFGGPHDYNALRGEPRLRMRHFPFAVDVAARDAWMLHMTNAVHRATTDELVIQNLMDYFSGTATFLINKGLAIGGK